MFIGGRGGEASTRMRLGTIRCAVRNDCQTRLVKEALVGVNA